MYFFIFYNNLYSRILWLCQMQLLEDVIVILNHIQSVKR